MPYFRKILIIVLILSGTICLGAYLGIQTLTSTHFPQSILKDKIEVEVGKALGHEVQIAGLDGNFITHIRLKGVRISDKKTLEDGAFIEVDRVIIRYNPILFLLNKGNILASISEINVESGTAFVKRSRSDRWNILEFLPPPDSTQPPLKFSSLLNLHNVRLHFLDERGWGAKPLEKPFNETMVVNGRMNFKDLHSVSYDIWGHTGSINRFAMTGLVNLLTGQYSLVADMERLSLSQWSRYIVPLDGMALTSGSATLKLNLKSRKLIKKTDLPFTYTIDAELANADLQLPYFPLPTRKLTGEIRIARDRIAFQQFKGELNNIPIVGRGEVDLGQGVIRMAINTDQFSLPRIKGLFPVLKDVDFNGSGKAEISITGPLANPVIEGYGKIPRVRSYSMISENLETAFRLQSGILHFGVISGSLYKGAITATGSVNLNAPLPIFDVQVSAKSIDLAAILPPNSVLKGHADIIAKLNGTSDLYRMNVYFTGLHLIAANQLIRKAHVEMLAQKNAPIQIKTGAVWINDGEPIAIAGTLDRSARLALQVSGSKIALKDFDPLVDPLAPAGSLALNGVFTATLSSAFWTNPIDHFQARAAVSLTGFQYWGYYVEQSHIAFSYQNNQLRLERLEFRNPGSNLTCEGLFDHWKLHDLTMTTSRFDLSSSQLIQRYIPSYLKPVLGLISMSIRVGALTDVLQPIDTQGLWLKSYRIEGDLKIENGGIKDQPFKQLDLVCDWDGARLEMGRFHIEQGKSKIAAHGLLDPEYHLDVVVEKGTVIDIEDFRMLKAMYPTSYGKLFFNGSIKGVITDPVLDIDVQGENMRFNYLTLEEFSGHINYSDLKLAFQNFMLRKGNDRYLFAGYLEATDFWKTRRFADLKYGMNASFNKVDVAALANLIRMAAKEYQESFAPPHRMEEETVQKNVTAVTSNVPSGYSISDPGYSFDQVQLYQFGSGTDSVTFYAQLKQKKIVIDESVAVGLDTLKGEISGQFTIRSRAKQTPLLGLDLTINDGEYLFLSAKTLRFGIHSDQDIMKWEVSFDNGTLGGKLFSHFASQGSLDTAGMLTIANTEMTASNRSRSQLVTGTIPISAWWDPSKKMANIALKINLTGDDIGLLSIVNPIIQDMTNDGRIEVILTGPLSDIQVNSTVFVATNLKIYLAGSTSFQSPLKFSSDKIAIKNNQLILPATTVGWQGGDTKVLNGNDQQNNQFILSGQVGLVRINLLQMDYLDIRFDLKMDDTDISINFPKIYNGGVGLRDFSVVGTYRIPFSIEEIRLYTQTLETDAEVGPIISGRIILSDGRIALPALGDKQPLPSFKLNLNLALKRDVLVSGGLFGEGFFANFANSFNLSFAETRSDLVISGTFNAPRISNQLYFSEGSVNFLNREFELMGAERQRDFYRDRPDMIYDNYIAFKSEWQPNSNAKRVLVPILNVKALTIIEADSLPSSASVSAAKAGNFGVVVLFNGPVSDLSSVTFEKYQIANPRARMMNPVFERKYTLATRSAGALRTSSDDMQDTMAIFELLLPDLIRSGYYQQLHADLDKDRTQKLLTDVGGKQINIWARSYLRPIEKDIARNIGLYDFRVDYNVGSAILNSNDPYDQTRSVGFNFISNLFSDQLFLRVKTNLDLSENRALTDKFRFTEFELNYFILRNLSFNFSNISDVGTQVYKPVYSIKFTHEF